MENKNILLWAIAGIAIVLSVIAIIAPKGLKSNAAMRTTQISSVQNAGPITLNAAPGDRPKVGNRCTIKATDEDGYEVSMSGTVESDGQGGLVCVSFDGKYRFPVLSGSAY